MKSDVLEKKSAHLYEKSASKEIVFDSMYQGKKIFCPPQNNQHKERKFYVQKIF